MCIIFNWYEKIFFKPILCRLDNIERILKMVDTKLSDVDAALADIGGVEDTLIGAVNKIDADYVALVAQVAANPSVDYQTELDAIAAQKAKILDAITSATASDPTV